MNAIPIPIHVDEFWTSKQRAAHSLHEISYRACFKPQLPRYFIERFSKPGDTVLDPFMGRGTTLLEAALLNRIPLGADINPVNRLLIAPRLAPPTLSQIEERLQNLNLRWNQPIVEDLLTFYHPKTLRELHALRNHFVHQIEGIDPVDDWIRMVATNRLTGHSPGFFSVYTLPPNQAVTVKRQRIINAQRKQKPEYRDTRALIIKKSRQLVKHLTSDQSAQLHQLAPASRILIEDASTLPSLATNSIDLVVTSPPFLDVVDYKTDNWLRCWFNGIDEASLPIWTAAMARVFQRLAQLLKPGGHIAFEVGEVRKGSIPLENAVIDAARTTSLQPLKVFINQQNFTKTSQCWGVDNRAKGTNTNRIVLLSKPK